MRDSYFTHLSDFLIFNKTLSNSSNNSIHYVIHDLSSCDCPYVLAMHYIFRPLSVSIAHAAAPQDDLFHHFFPSKDHFYLHTPAHFGIYYDSRSRTPKWVLEHFHRNTSLSANSNKLKRPAFFSDVKVDDAFQVCLPFINVIISHVLQLSPRDYTNRYFSPAM